MSEDAANMTTSFDSADTRGSGSGVVCAEEAVLVPRHAERLAGVAKSAMKARRDCSRVVAISGGDVGNMPASLGRVVPKCLEVTAARQAGKGVQ